MKRSRAQVTRLFNRFVAAANDPDVVPFGAAGPSPRLMPTALLSRLLRQAVRSEPLRSVCYDMPPGNPALRAELSLRARTWGCRDLDPGEIVLTSGTMEALNLSLLAAFRPGARVAVESPVYYGILQAVEALGMTSVEIRTDPAGGMCPDALEEAVERRRVDGAVLVSNFNNPLGSLVSEAHKRRIVALLARRGLPLVEDDIYGDLSHGPERPVTAKSFDRRGLVLLCGSVSKTLAPGYRIGWVAAGRFTARVRELKFVMSIGNSVPAQMAVAEFFRSGRYQAHLEKIRGLYRRQVKQVREAVLGHFPPGTRISTPVGGFLLWVTMPRGVDASSLLERALDHKITLTPGSWFSPSGRFGNCLRLSCGNPWDERFADAVRTVGRLAGRQIR